VWLDLLESDPMAFVYQTPAGLDAICAGNNCEDASRLYEFPDGRKMVLPLFRRKGLPLILAVEKSPLVGSLVCVDVVRPDELRAIFSDLARRPLLQTILRPTALAGDAWAAAVPRDVISLPHLSHVLDLDGGFEAVWEKRFNRQARRAIRKAERAGLEVECDATGKLVPVFYELLQSSVDRWAGQGHEPQFLARWRAKRRDPMRKLQILTETLGEACQIRVARVDGQPAAAIVVLQGSNAHYTRGAMDIDLAGPVRASFLLQKLAIEAACEAGCRYYNMGETGTSENLARFKSHFGAQAYNYSEYRFERLPVTNLNNGVRGFVKKLIR
jgi:CelD/BcsL family acetyltransferase involved in cellulose biosynthesis